MNQSLGLGLGPQSLGLETLSLGLVLGLETQSLGLCLGLVDPSLDYITALNLCSENLYRDLTYTCPCLDVLCEWQ